MPNWCYSSVTIHSEKADVLEKELKEALSKNPAKAEFGNSWLGNLLLHLGHKTEDVRKENVARCRGSVDWWDRLAKDEISLQTESAWVPHLECVEMFAKHYDLDAEVIYTADEPNKDIYWTNDPAVVGDIYVNSNADELGGKWRELIEDCADRPVRTVIPVLAEFLGIPCKTEMAGGSLVVTDEGVKELAKSLSVPDPPLQEGKVLKHLAKMVEGLAQKERKDIYLIMEVYQWVPIGG